MQKSSFDMEKKKIVLTLSKVFPVTSSQAGEPTGFEEKLKTGVKLHTIRANKAGVWDKRAKEIAEGGRASRTTASSGSLPGSRRSVSSTW